MVNSSSIFTVEILNSITPEKPTNDLGSKQIFVNVDPVIRNNDGSMQIITTTYHKHNEEAQRITERSEN